MTNDLTIYESHAREWWNPRSPWFRSLHGVHEYRSALLDEWLGARLRAATVVDLGCGGGLLAEPLARAGARVVGVELGHASVAAARAHLHEAAADGRLDYVRADALRAPLADGCADVVVIADVLEHVPSWRAAIAEAARLLRPGGLLYANTINRTWWARLLAVVVAESIGLVPRGTHDHRLFIRPDELVADAKERGLALVRLCGERPRLWRTLRTRAIHLAPAQSTRLAYSVLFEKPGPYNSARGEPGTG
jgi:2-polyprenyl-6-hydroxyphenyl methylase/3-demethylubiquinone-9 3-methyltransferase